MTRPLLRALPAAVLLVPFLGCTAILDFPDPVDSFQWCIDANPARGRNETTNSLFNIVDPSGNWLRGCKCFCPEDNEVMVLGEAGMLAPGSGHESWYLNEVELLRAKAAEACAERVSMLQEQLGTTYTFNDPETVSCADSVVDESPYYSSGCVRDDDICPGGGPGVGPAPGTGGVDTGSGTAGVDTGTGTDGADTTGADEAGDGSGGAGGAVAYGLEDWSSVINCPTAEGCDVAGWFVDELLEDLSVFEDDAIQIYAGAKSSLGHQGFRFASLGPESLPAALGFQEGDLLWGVNGIMLSDFAAIGRAFEELNQAVDFTARFDRNGEVYRRSFHLVPAVNAN